MPQIGRTESGQPQDQLHLPGKALPRAAVSLSRSAGHPLSKALSKHARGLFRFGIVPLELRADRHDNGWRLPWSLMAATRKMDALAFFESRPGSKPCLKPANLTGFQSQPDIAVRNEIREAA
jgi:hypothetical protein